MATLDALSRQPDIQDYSATSQFKVGFTNFPLMEWFCTSITIPSITLGVVERETPMVMAPVAGDKMTFANLDFTMLVDEELKNYQEAYEWMVNIGFPANHAQFSAKESIDGIAKIGERDLYSDMQIIILSSKNNPVVAINIYDAFPISLSGLTYSTQDTDSTFLTADVSFAYSYYDFGSV